jgi:sulfite exporter TauE/SafE
VAAIGAGIIMIALGVAVLLQTRGIDLRCGKLPDGVQKTIQRGVAFAHRQPPLRRSLIIGLLTGFLPCGWLYAFVITAAGTGSAAWGAATMVAFWAGTVPILFAIGIGIQHLVGPLRRHVPTLTACALVGIGIVAVVGRLNVPAYAGIEPVAGEDPAARATVEHVHELGEEVPACCLEHD